MDEWFFLFCGRELKMLRLFFEFFCCKEMRIFKLFFELFFCKDVRIMKFVSISVDRRKRKEVLVFVVWG